VNRERGGGAPRNTEKMLTEEEMFRYISHVISQIEDENRTMVKLKMVKNHSIRTPLWSPKSTHGQLSANRESRDFSIESVLDTNGTNIIRHTMMVSIVLESLIWFYCILICNFDIIFVITLLEDNPPPKIVQGYRFNIFFPDLVDSKKTPQYRLEKSENPDFVIIRFSSGPPYEVIIQYYLPNIYVGYRISYRKQGMGILSQERLSMHI
jgi:hypothetical protein